MAECVIAHASPTAGCAPRCSWHAFYPPLRHRLAAFIDYEKEFQGVIASLPGRISALQTYEASPDAAAPEL